MATTPMHKRFRFPIPSDTTKEGTYKPGYFARLATAIINKGHKLISADGVEHLRRNVKLLHSGDIVLAGDRNIPETWAMHNGALTHMVAGQEYDLELEYEVGSSRLDRKPKNGATEVVILAAEFVGFLPVFDRTVETRFVGAEGASA